MRALLEHWHGVDEPRPIPLPLTPKQESFLLAREDEQRESFLSLARRRQGSFELDHVHPSWIVSCLPEDPLLRTWSIEVLPSSVREGVARLVHCAKLTTLASAGPAPRWFPAWWRSRLHADLAYPRALPGTVDPRTPSSYLWRLRADDLERFLAWTGLRPLAAAVVDLDRSLILELLFSFDEPTRQHVVDMVKRRDFPGVPWQKWLGDPQSPDFDPGAVATTMAVHDLVAQCAARNRLADAHRVAFRLPRPFGRRILEAAHTDLSELEVEDPQLWDEWLREDLKGLVGAGKIAAPDLTEEVF